MTLLTATVNGTIEIFESDAFKNLLIECLIENVDIPFIGRETERRIYEALVSSMAMAFKNTLHGTPPQSLINSNQNSIHSRL
jgi:hypothetical protein